MPFETRTKSYALQNSVIAILLLQVLAAAVWIIVLYNRKVDYTNGASKMREETQLTQARSVQDQEKTFSIFHGGEVEQFARGLGLIKEQHPEYIEISKPWVSASRS